MNDKGSLYIITSEESQIANYSVKFDAKTIKYDKHIGYLINFIFTSKRARDLCNLFGIYSQREFKELTEIEIIAPLVKFGLAIITGISENLLIYLPNEWDSKQIIELTLILEEYKNTNINLRISRMNVKHQWDNEQEMTIEEFIGYLNQNPTNIETISHHLK